MAQKANPKDEKQPETAKEQIPAPAPEKPQTGVRYVDYASI